MFERSCRAGLTLFGCHFFHPNFDPHGLWRYFLFFKSTILLSFTSVSSQTSSTSSYSKICSATRGSPVSHSKVTYFPKSFRKNFPLKVDYFPSRNAHVPSISHSIFQNVPTRRTHFGIFSPKCSLTFTAWAPTTFPIKYFTLTGCCFWNKNYLIMHTLKTHIVDNCWFRRQLTAGRDCTIKNNFYRQTLQLVDT